MSQKPDQPITVEQAAGMIFQTSVPTPFQVGEVGELMRTGVLPISERGGLTTTRTGVARYLAGREQRRLEAKRDRPASVTPGGRRQAAKEDDDCARQARPRRGSRVAGDRKLRGVYRELLNDYFLSVLSRDRARRHSPEFQKVVVVLRCMLLVGVLSLLIGAISLIRFSNERQVVRAWLNENRAAAELIEIAPAHFRPGGQAVRVRYRMPESDQPAQVIDRVFVIDGDDVVNIVLPDDEDERLMDG